MNVELNNDTTKSNVKNKKSQVFNKEISLKCLYQTLVAILQEVCPEPFTQEYIITKAVFKRAEIHNIIDPFISSIKPYYYFSKQHYVNRQINYNGFITILRQLCNVNDIKYSSKIVYIKSNYEIEYTIVFPPLETLSQ